MWVNHCNFSCTSTSDAWCLHLYTYTHIYKLVICEQTCKHGMYLHLSKSSSLMTSMHFLFVTLERILATFFSLRDIHGLLLSRTVLHMVIYHAKLFGLYSQSENRYCHIWSRNIWTKYGNTSFCSDCMAQCDQLIEMSTQVS